MTLEVEVHSGSASAASIPQCGHPSSWGGETLASVLILNWNGKRFLGPCLKSVLRNACIHTDVCVVDNGSTDGSVGYLAETFPQVRLVELRENLGYGRAYNQAVNSARGRYIVFLNNDTVVEPNWLMPLLTELAADASVAITTSKILFSESRVINALGGQLKLWQGGSELGFGMDETYLSALPVIEPFYASGSAMAIDRELFLRLGAFDERLWLYAEDLDLSWRARLSGYKVRCVPASVVYHHYSGTSGVFSPVKHRLGTTHYLMVMVKCLALRNLVHSFPAFMLFSLAKGVGVALAEGDLAFALNPLGALRDVFRERTQLRSARRSTQQIRVAPDRTVLASQGLGLFDSPMALLRVFKQGRRLKRRPEQISELALTE